MINPCNTRTISSRAYFLSTVMLGFALIGFCYHQVLSAGLDSRWMILAALTIMVAAFTLKIPGVNSKISVADTFILLNLIFFGPAIGCLTAALEAFGGSLRSSTVSRRLEFTLFNMANAAICTYVAGRVYFLALGGGPLVQNRTATLAGVLPAAVLMAAGYFLLNSGTVALMVALESSKNFIRIWKSSFLLYAANHFVSALGAAVIAMNGDLITPVSLLAAGFTAMAIYAAYRLIHGRIAAHLPA